MSLTVQKSTHGRGIFAERDYAAGEDLYEVTGTFVSGDEDADMDESMRSNTFRYSEESYISPAGLIGDFQNHSCEPNAKVAKRDDRLFVVAIGDIQKGAEVLIDYSTIIAADDVWEMRCACKSASCRGTVRSFDTLPSRLRKRYIKDGIVPQYIREI